MHHADVREGKRCRAAFGVAVVAVCLLAWCGMSAVPLPGLAPDAVARQLAGYPLRVISVAVVGTGPVVLVMFVLFALVWCWPRVQEVTGGWGSRRHQRWMAGGILADAAIRSRGVIRDLTSSGQLGSAAIDPYLVSLGVLSRTAVTHLRASARQLQRSDN